MYVNAPTREILLVRRGRVTRSRGIRNLANLKKGPRRILLHLGWRGRKTLDEICDELKVGRRNATRWLSELEALGSVRASERGGRRWFEPAFKFEHVPQHLMERSVLDAEGLPKTERLKVEDGHIIDPLIDGKGLEGIIGVWDGADVSGHELVYYPCWRAVFESRRGARAAIYDGLTGQRDAYLERMLRHRCA